MKRSSPLPRQSRPWHRCLALAWIWCFLLGLGAAVPAYALTAPYPWSTYITNVTFNFNTATNYSKKSGTDGSDIWCYTWAADNNIYTAYGDGFGFNGPNHVSFGFSKMAGPFEQFTNTDIYYGPTGSDHGKVSSMLAISNSTMNVVYAWLDLQDAGGGNSSNSILLSSTNMCVSWKTNACELSHLSEFYGGFVQFGKNFSGNSDGYAYYCGGFPNNSDAYLVRVPIASITNKTTFQYLTNIDGSNQAYWGAAANAIPMFHDPNGWGGGGEYNAGLGRWIITGSPQPGDGGCVSMFEGPTMWGPWKTIYYATNWANLENNSQYNNANNQMEDFGFPAKFNSADGTLMGMFASVYDTSNTVWNDQLLTMTVTLATNSAYAAPPAPTGLTVAQDATHPSMQLDEHWNSVTGATGYILSRSTTSGGPYSVVTNTAVTTNNDATVFPGTTYYYVVAATSATGSSTNSAQVSAATRTNAVPTLNSIANLTTNMNAPQQVVNLSNITPGANESGVQAITNVTASSSNTGLIPNPAVSYSNPNTTGTLTFTPVANASGTATVTVTVQDNGGTAGGGVNAVTQSFLVTITSGGSSGNIYSNIVNNVDINSVMWTDNGGGATNAPSFGNTFVIPGTSVPFENTSTATTNLARAYATNTTSPYTMYFKGDSLSLGGNWLLKLKGPSSGSATYTAFTFTNSTTPASPGLLLNGGMIEDGETAGVVLTNHLFGVIGAASGTLSYLSLGGSQFYLAGNTKNFYVSATVVSNGNIMICGGTNGGAAFNTVVFTNATPASTFSGTWIIEGGYMYTAPNAVAGAYGNNCSFIVDNLYPTPVPWGSGSPATYARLDLSIPLTSTGTLIVTNSGQLFVNAAATFSTIKIAGTTLSAGSYTAATLATMFPANIVSGGSGTLTATSGCTPPTAVVSGGGTIILGGSTNIQAALTGVAPWNITWSDGFNQPSVASSPATRSVSPTVTTTYTVTSVADSGACSPGTASGSALVTVTAAATIYTNIVSNIDLNTNMWTANGGATTNVPTHGSGGIENDYVMPATPVPFTNGSGTTLNLARATTVGSPATSFVFQGDSLSVGGNWLVKLKGSVNDAANSFTFTNSVHPGSPGLILNGGMIEDGAGSGAPIDTNWFFGVIEAAGGSLSYISLSGTEFYQPGQRTHNFEIAATVVGSGNVMISGGTNSYGAAPSASVIFTNAPATASSFSGTWIVEGGYMTTAPGAAAGAYGSNCSFIVDNLYPTPVPWGTNSPAPSARLDLSIPVTSTGTLIVTNSGQLYVNAAGTFNTIAIAGTWLTANTTYTAATLATMFPGNIVSGGSGTLKATSQGHIVKGPAPLVFRLAQEEKGGQLVLSGSGGSANGTYRVLSSINPALPLAGWTLVLTNAFGGDGNFSNPITINPTEAQRFYRIVAP